MHSTPREKSSRAEANEQVSYGTGGAHTRALPVCRLGRVSRCLCRCLFRWRCRWCCRWRPDVRRGPGDERLHGLVERLVEAGRCRRAVDAAIGTLASNTRIAFMRPPLRILAEKATTAAGCGVATMRNVRMSVSTWSSASKASMRPAHRLEVAGVLEALDHLRLKQHRQIVAPLRVLDRGAHAAVAVDEDLVG